MKKLIASGLAALAIGVASAGATNGPALGLKADGMRLQAMAQRYQQLHGYTPAALEAMGARWQAMADLYARPSAVLRPDDRAGVRGTGVDPTRVVVATAGGSSFDWGDAGIGAAGGLISVGFAAATFALVRRSRRTKLAL